MRKLLLLHQISDESGGIPPSQTQTEYILSLTPYAYFPLNESEGTVAVNVIDNGLNGFYTNNAAPGAPGIGDGNTCASFPDGVTDAVGVGLTRFLFDGDNGSFAMWAKASDWNDATVRYLMRIAFNGINQVYIRKDATLNQLTFNHTANSVVKSIVTTELGGDTGFFHLAMTWQASGSLKAYINGVEVGEQTGLGVFSGTPVSGTCALGAAASSGTTCWHGSIAHCAFWDRVLIDSEIAGMIDNI